MTFLSLALAYLGDKSRPRKTITDPFTLAVYPNHEFPSMNCFLQRWEMDHGKPFCVSVGDVVTLSPENKDALLQVSLKKHQTVASQAEKWISGIAELDSDIGNAFQTKASATKNTVVRMVRLQTSIGETQIRSPLVESFIALSYCWQSSRWRVVESLQEEASSSRQRGTVPISGKMWAALSILRNSEDEAVWVDQLCINQGDPAEKHDAIAGMDVIYHCARLVVVPLEDIEFSKFQFNVWNKSVERWCAGVSQKGTNAEWAPTREEVEVITGLLNKLFSARWFSRAWCFQEYLVARNCVFLISCDGDIVQLPSVGVMVTISTRIGVRGLMHPSVLKTAHGFNYKFSHGPNPSIMELFAHLTFRRSSITSDKLAIMLNMSGLSISYKSETATADENCYIAMILALATGDMSPLCNDGKELQLGSSQSIKSWIRWPSLTILPTSAIQLEDSTSLVFLGPGCLQLDLYILEGRRSTPSESSKQRALSFLKSEHGATLLSALIVGEPRVEDYVGALATALELGLEWMAESYIVGNSESYPQDKPGLERVVRENRHLGSSIIENLVAGSTTESALELNEKDLEEPILRYMVRLLAYGLPLDSSISLNSAGLQATCSIFPPQAVLAIPVDLAGPKFSYQKRLWQLERADGDRDGVWIVAGKSILYGCSSINEEEGFVSLRPKQMVVGGTSKESCRNKTKL